MGLRSNVKTVSRPQGNQPKPGPMPPVNRLANPSVKPPPITVAPVAVTTTPQRPAAN